MADVLTPGLYAYWTVMKNVRIERVDAPTVRFESLALAKVLTLPRTAHLLSSSTSTRVRSVCSP